MSSNYISFFVFVIILIGTIIIITILSNAEYNQVQENFIDYQDAKTKTLNWCSKLQKNGLLNSDQFNQCITDFKDTSSGIFNSGIVNNKTGMNYNYSIYNTRKTKLSQSINNQSGDENNNTITLSLPNNLTLAIKSDNTNYLVPNINDFNVNQKEILFTLEPLNENAFSIISPYGLLLVANNDFTASFTGKSAGPLASWNVVKINDSLANDNVSKIMIESVQFPNYHLIYNMDTNLFSIKYGTSDEMVWTISTMKISNVDNNEDLENSKYLVLTQNILYSAKQNLIKKICYRIAIDALNQLSSMITNNFNDIKNHLQSFLMQQQNTYNVSIIDYNTRTESINTNSLIDNQTKQNLIKNIPRPLGLDISDQTISNLLLGINNKKNSLLQSINNNGIIKMQNKLNELNNKDATQTDYDNLINILNTELENVNKQIKKYKTVILRQKNTSDSINSDYYHQKNKLNKLDNTNKISNLNINLLNDYESQNSYLNKVYPVAIFILLIILLYLLYSTYNKFIKNIWSNYS
jgi:hypothetical protein